MGIGITGATVTSLSNGTTANAPDVLGSLQSLQANGVNNDGGAIQTNGAGLMTLLGMIINGPLQSNPAAVTVNGTTAGTATLYQFLQGAIKAFYLYYNGYRNSTTTEQKLALPVPFTSRSAFFAQGGIPVTHIYLSGVQVMTSCNVIVLLPSGSGAGNISVQSAMNGFSSGELVGAYDSIGLGVSQSMTFTAGLFVIGI